MFRLLIDVPLSEKQDKAVEISKQIADFLTTMKVDGVTVVQYRLGNDFDRGVTAVTKLTYP